MSRASRRLNRESSKRADNACVPTDNNQTKRTSIYIGNNMVNVNNLHKKLQQTN